MKHIFYVQSNISKLVALKVIEDKDICTNDIVFICGRGVNINKDIYYVINADEYLFEYNKFFWRTWKIYEASKNKLNNALLSIEDEEFELYTSSFSRWFISHIKRKSNFKAISFLEEGLSGYYSKEEYINFTKSRFFNLKYFFFKVKSFLGTKMQQDIYFVWQLIKYLEGCKNIYTLSKVSHFNLPNKYVVELPFEYNEEFTDIKVVIAPSALVETGLTNEESFDQAINHLFDTLKKERIKKVHIKYHPLTISNTKYYKLYRKIILKHSGSIEVIELGHNTILENIAFSSDCTFYTCISSIGLYAQLCNNPVYSYAKSIAQHDKRFKTHYISLPKVIRFKNI